MHILRKADLRRLTGTLAERYALYGPVHHEVSGEVIFDLVSDPGEIDLDAPIPYNPPKGVVFPQAERIMSFAYDRETKAVSVEPAVLAAPKALVGLRACDLNGLLCLDRFMLGQEYVDDVFLEHRKKMFIVSNVCVHPFPQCFCVCTDSGPAAVEGFDLDLTDIGDEYLVLTGSAKGEELVRGLGLAEAPAVQAALRSRAIEASVALFDAQARDNKAWISRAVNRITTGFIPHGVWEYVGDQCFECGACAFVCPSCSCFNIEDAAEGEGRSGRTRAWDSCSFEGYARMAGDHNPRKAVEDRRNKRFFCKLSFSQSRKYLRPGCVGCGRCVRVCPGDIGLPNVVTAIRRETTKQVPHE